MLRLRPVCLMCIALSLSNAALAQAAPDAATAEPVTWVSGQATDPAGTRTCSVYPVRQGAFPMIFFYGSESGPELSVEGAGNTPMVLRLQVDANAALGGGFPTMWPKNTAALVRQIRADGRTLRLSQSAMAGGRLETFDLDLALAGAVEQLDKCKAWLAS